MREIWRVRNLSDQTISLENHVINGGGYKDVKGVVGIAVFADSTAVVNALANGLIEIDRMIDGILYEVYDSSNPYDIGPARISDVEEVINSSFSSLPSLSVSGNITASNFIGNLIGTTATLSSYLSVGNSGSKIQDDGNGGFYLSNALTATGAIYSATSISATNGLYGEFLQFTAGGQITQNNGHVYWKQSIFDTAVQLDVLNSDGSATLGKIITPGICFHSLGDTIDAIYQTSNTTVVGGQNGVLLQSYPSALVTNIAQFGSSTSTLSSLYGRVVINGAVDDGTTALQVSGSLNVSGGVTINGDINGNGNITATNSIQIGSGNTQSGYYSTQSGYYNTQSGNNSTQSGNNNHQSGYDSTQSGRSNTQSGNGNTQSGNQNNQIGNCSTQSGYYNTQSGNGSTQSGYYNTQSGNYSTQSGRSNTQSGNGNHQSGRSNTQSGNGNHQSGRINTQSGYGNTQSGNQNNQIGKYSTQSGYINTQSGNCSTQSGYINTQSGNGSTQSGYYNTQSGYYSTQSGNSNTQSGNNSTQSGNNNHQSGYGSTQSGRSNTQSGYQNTQSGYQNNQIGNCNTQSGSSNTQSGNYSTQSGYMLNDSGFNFVYQFGSSNTAAVGNTAYFALSNGIRLVPQNTSPSTPEEGTMYWDSTAHALKVYNGTAWKMLTAV